MMKKLVLCISFLLLPCVSLAGPLYSFGDLDFNGYQLLNTITGNVDNPDLAGVSVTSSVYSDGSEYLYAYQIANNSDVTLQNLIVPDFAGAIAGSLGYTALNLPTEFDTQVDVVPIYGEIAANGSSVQFEFHPDLDFAELAPGTTSAVLVVKSTEGWAQTQGFVQNGETGSVDVISVVPEPASIALLSLGSLVLARRRK